MSANHPIILAQSLSCNTPQKVSVPEKLIAKSIWVHEKHEIVVLKPTIDTIVLTINGNEALGSIKPNQFGSGVPTALGYWSAFYQRVIEEFNQPDNDEITPGQSFGSNYLIAADLNVGGGKTARLYTKPKSPKSPAVRLEYSPAKWSAKNFAKFLDIWHSLDLDNVPFASLMADARIVRLDVAVDVLNVRPVDLLVFSDKVFKTWTAASMYEGAETFQFYTKTLKQKPHVNPKKRAQLMVYDKRLERIAMGAKPRFGDLWHTRLEFSRRTNRFLKSLPGLPCPYKDWEVRRTLSSKLALPDWLWPMFLDSIRLRGWSETSKLIPKSMWTGATGSGPDEFPADIVVASEFAEQWPSVIQDCHLGEMVSWAKANPAKFIPVGLLKTGA